ncbi:nuclear transport factor 2 family protein [Acidobacteria bacterium AB60]|nr:nuclear transport factor 2 family protein [Acidobacteria bacterium AB60]
MESKPNCEAPAVIRICKPFRFLLLLLVAGGFFVLSCGRVFAQMLEPPAAAATPDPMADPTMKAGKALLFQLEGKFAADVAARGGAGFADWFAEDGVALGNGAAPLVGKVAIARSATWSPQGYQLTWKPTDGLMGPSGDMGYTWGHYEGHSKDANGNPVTTSGRYMTIWRKQADGSWKVVLDAGSTEPAASGDCCRLPTGTQ